jgi:ABC-type polysaccharide/polyol phosphate export permease
VLLLPAALLLEIGAIVGVSLITGAFYVAFRDVRYAVESSLVLGVYATPILYPLSRVPHELQWLFRLNPMTGVLSLTRAATLSYSVDLASVLSSIGVTAVLLTIGAVVFRRRSGEFADLL